MSVANMAMANAWAAIREPASRGRTELRKPLTECLSAFGGIALFSCISNVLMLTGSLFMLEVYDRVLPSHSIPTLTGLVILASGLYLVQGVLDVIRGRMLVRIGAHFDASLTGRIFDGVVWQTLRSAGRGDSLQATRDLDTVRSFMSGQGPTTIFDLPWIPVYLFVIFAFHSSLGIAASAGAILLVSLTLLTEMLTRTPAKVANGFAGARARLGEDSRRNAEVLLAMGMAKQLGRRWGALNQQYIATQVLISDVAGGLGGIAKVVRLMLQSAVLALGAYLVIRGEASAGVIIASSILTSRALAPVELAIAHWKGFVAARNSWGRLEALFGALPSADKPLQLQPPKISLAVEGALAFAPGSSKALLQDVSFSIVAGQAMGIVGPSGSGKSSLARLLVGVWSPARGRIRLDGASLDQWASQQLGSHIGYLPQDVELFSGTVAQNIARFETGVQDSAIVAAAESAGAHEMVVCLPQGYETEIGEHGTLLSAGQRQRIALARALYGSPFLVVLDEPNSNLDPEGEAALSKAIQAVKNRGGIVVVVAHRPLALTGVDFILALQNGRMRAFGPKDETMAGLYRPAVVPVAASRKAS